MNSPVLATGTERGNSLTREEANPGPAPSVSNLAVSALPEEDQILSPSGLALFSMAMGFGPESVSAFLGSATSPSTQPSTTSPVMGALMNPNQWDSAMLAISVAVGAAVAAIRDIMEESPEERAQREQRERDEKRDEENEAIRELGEAQKAMKATGAAGVGVVDQAIENLRAILSDGQASSYDGGLSAIIANLERLQETLQEKSAS